MEARPNLDQQFLAALTGGWKPQQPARSLPAQAGAQSAQADFAKVAATSSRPTPEDIFHYIYAIFHAPAYRARYAEFLKIDFPRVPLTSSLDLFRGLAALGGDLVALHLLEDDYPGASWHVGDHTTGDHGGSPVQRPITAWVGPDGATVEKVAYADGVVWVDKAQTAGFRGVPPAVWDFHIGGYQVCEKWLKDRKGRVLSEADIAHYQRVVVALNETIRIMGEIDALIEAHGGWPIQ